MTVGHHMEKSHIDKQTHTLNTKKSKKSHGPINILDTIIHTEYMQIRYIHCTAKRLHHLSNREKRFFSILQNSLFDHNSV